jgi:hypothetical protein
MQPQGSVLANFWWLFPVGAQNSALAAEKNILKK